MICIILVNYNRFSPLQSKVKWANSSIITINQIIKTMLDIFVYTKGKQTPLRINLNIFVMSHSNIKGKN